MCVTVHVLLMLLDTLATYCTLYSLSFYRRKDDSSGLSGVPTRTRKI